MDNNNPAEMSNQDLENDMEQKNHNSRNQENVKKTTASEGKLLDPSNDPASVQNLSSGKQTELDSSGNIKSDNVKSEGNQDGSMPDPEEVDLWENNDTGDKMSS